MFNTDLAENI